MNTLVRVAGCAAIAVSAVLMIGILAAGPSPAVPVVGTDAPPWSLDLRPSGRWVCVAAWAATIMGAAAAVKLPYALAGAGLVWAFRRPSIRLVVGAAGVLAVGYWPAGPAALRVVREKATGLSEIDLWRVPLQLAGLRQWDHEGLAAGLALGAAALLTCALLWRLPPGPAGQPAVRVALAVCVAWAVTSPLQRPWYDALVFPLLALMPATRLSGLLLIQLAAANLAHLPGVAGRGWPLPWMRHVLIPWVTPSIILATVAGLFVVLALPIRSRQPVDTTLPSPRRLRTPRPRIPVGGAR